MRCLASAILPAFGQREISTINRSDVEFFLADRAQAYCKNTLRGMRVSLGRVLSWAGACDWIEKNPCSGVALPQAGKRVKRTVLKPEQVLAIASALVEPYSTIVLFLASTGPRVSEAAAIRWEDFDGDVLHVHRRLYDGWTRRRRQARNGIYHSHKICCRVYVSLVGAIGLSGRTWEAPSILAMR